MDREKLVQITDAEMVKTEIYWELLNLNKLINFKEYEEPQDSVESKRVEALDPATESVVCYWNLAIKALTSTSIPRCIAISVKSSRIINGLVTLKFTINGNRKVKTSFLKSTRKFDSDTFTFPNGLKILEFIFDPTIPERKLKDATIYCSIEFAINPLDLLEKVENPGKYSFFSNLLSGSLFMSMLEQKKPKKPEIAPFKGQQLGEPKKIYSESEISQSLKTLFDSETFSDLILEAEGKEIKTHKTILIAQSDVFAAMFFHNFEENQTNRIIFQDIRYPVLYEVINYFYSNELPNIKKMVFEVFMFADKYHIGKLKRICFENFVSVLTVKTAIQTLKIAHEHREHELKNYTIQFIKFNLKPIVMTEEWFRLSMELPALIGEVIDDIDTVIIAELMKEYIWIDEGRHVVNFEEDWLIDD